ncbi:MAG: hypothetical protein LBK99_02090 [Opitutaceae bacterium]|nr:hypothetical protein [Opitutaceae bacterium]
MSEASRFREVARASRPLRRGTGFQPVFRSGAGVSPADGEAAGSEWHGHLARGRRLAPPPCLSATLPPPTPPPPPSPPGGEWHRWRGGRPRHPDQPSLFGGWFVCMRLKFLILDS